MCQTVAAVIMDITGVTPVPSRLTTTTTTALHNGTSQCLRNGTHSPLPRAPSSTTAHTPRVKSSLLEKTGFSQKGVGIVQFCPNLPYPQVDERRLYFFTQGRRDKSRNCAPRKSLCSEREAQTDIHSPVTSDRNGQAGDRG